MKANNKFKKLIKCRVCGSKNLISYLNLGIVPLANSFLPRYPKDEEKYPLEVLVCQDCFFSQLSVVVDPEHLFRNYAYSSTISNTFKEHCEELAKELCNDILKKGEQIIDIASNDGSLLVPFEKRGIDVLGIDPARNMAKKANEAGIETVCDFWDEKTAKKLLKSHGKAKIITAFNVFAHVDDMHSFVEGAKTMLDNKGYLIIESPHISSMLRNTEFDTIYHEHLSYLSLKPLKSLVGEHGLRLSRVKKFDIHGGSIRMYIEHISRDTSDGSVERLIEEETRDGIYSLTFYESYQKEVERIKKSLVDTLVKIKKQGKSISAFGASAKGNTLLNYCEIDDKIIDFIFDHTPEKQNKLYAGVHIAVIHPNEIEKKKPDYLLLLAWNFANELMAKTKDHQKRGGKYIIPIPRVKII